MKITPLFDRVVLKPIKPSAKTSSGIVLPAVAQEKTQLATVVYVGQGGDVDGKRQEMVVKKGDKVLYSKFAGTDIKFGGEDLLVIRQADILAIIED